MSTKTSKHQVPQKASCSFNFFCFVWLLRATGVLLIKILFIDSGAHTPGWYLIYHSVNSTNKF